jgi:hypothetical protein
MDHPYTRERMDAVFAVSVPFNLLSANPKRSTGKRVAYWGKTQRRDCAPRGTVPMGRRFTQLC